MVPNAKVTANDAATFKPFDPNQAIGNTSPTLPYILPPPKQHCGALAKVIQIVVTAVVSFFVAPLGPIAAAAIGAAAGNHAGQMASLMLNGQYDWGRALRFGVNPFGGNSGDLARSIYDPAAQGAPGKIDYRSIAVSAGTAAATRWVSQLTTDFGPAINTAAQVATSYAANYQLSKWAGYDVSWSNRQLGSNLASAYASDWMFGGGDVETRGDATSVTRAPGQAITSFDWKGLVRGFAQNVGRSAIQHASDRAFGVRDASWNWKNVTADAFGNVIASAIVGRLEARQDRELIGEIQSGASVMQEGFQADALKDGVDIGAMSADDLLAYANDWLARPRKMPGGESASDRLGLFGMADLSDMSLRAGWPTIGQSSELAFDMALNPKAKAEMAWGMLVGVIGSAAEDVEGVIGLAEATVSARNDMAILMTAPIASRLAARIDDETGNNRASYLQKRLYTDALGRTAGRYKSLVYIANNLGTVLKDGVGAEWDAMRRSYNNAIESSLEGDYYDSGVAYGELAYKVVPLLTGVYGGVRAGLAMGSRIAKVGFDAALREAASIVRGKAASILRFEAGRTDSLGGGDIGGAASVGDRSVKWSRNPGNAMRSPAQALDLLYELNPFDVMKQLDPDLDPRAFIDVDDLEFKPMKGGDMDAGVYARYKLLPDQGDGNKMIPMAAIFAPGKKFGITIRQALFRMDDGLVDIMSHEYFELVKLKNEFLKNGGALPAQRISGLLETDPAKMQRAGMARNFHTEAHVFGARMTKLFQGLVKSGNMKRFSQ